ncbi:hypothetical protein PCE1_000440 [Barthelona sp. PCE]
MAEYVGRVVAAAQGTGDLSLLLQNLKIFDVRDGHLSEETDIAILDGVIVGIGAGIYTEAVKKVNCVGLIAVPGFIDSHVHIESSLLAPAHFSSLVTKYGTTTCVCDPHELANVVGGDAVRYVVESNEVLPNDLKCMVPSCVPATHLESNGSVLDAEAIAELADLDGVLGLAEVMNVPGVLYQDSEMMKKLAIFKNRQIDGHAPSVSGAGLNAYMAAGVRNDHECTTADEAREKVRKGMHVFIREGSACKDLYNLIGAVTNELSDYFSFCTDDKNCVDIEATGHIDTIIRRAILSGLPLHLCYKLATLSAARHFGFSDRGLIAPGMRADIVLVSDLHMVSVEQVVINGTLRSEAKFPLIEHSVTKRATCVVLSELDPLMLKDEQRTDFVIGVHPGSIVTEKLTCCSADEIDMCGVIHRHGHNANRCIGSVKGFQLKKGCALATTIAHDSHNIVFVASDAEKAVIAIERLVEIGGGMCVVEGDKVVDFPLEIGGLMTGSDMKHAMESLELVHNTAKSISALEEPFMTLSFIALPVIPSLKITDKGLVDVEKFDFV